MDFLTRQVSMPDDPAFIRMIAAAPDDDAPRLVYADVLEESGDPAKMARAEFIRVQIEKARLVPDTPRWNELWHRDTALLDWARQWRAELPVIEDVKFGGYIRGFIDSVTAPAQRLSRGLRTLHDLIPIRKIVLGATTVRSARALLKSSLLLEVSELEFSQYIAFEAATLREFTSHGPWPRLKRVHLPMFGTSAWPPLARETRAVWEVIKAAFGDRVTT